MFAVLAGVSMLATQLLPAKALAATYSQELQDAYNWAYSKGVTTMSPIDNANMYGAITRSEMAKMLSVYATEVLGMTPDTSAACTFSDIDSVKGDLHDYIIESCQLGIMGQGISAFRPYDTISRAEFGTALSRVLWGSQYEGGTPYYAKHLDALKAAGIMTQIANAESTKEIRGYVMLMLMRSEGSTPSICEDTDVKVICAVEAAAEEYKDCPVACRAEANEPAEDVVVKSGDLAVTATAAQGRKILIGGISDLDTLTFRSSEEVSLTKVILERYGYSQNADVVGVWLEDEDGNKIADEKPLDSKWQAKLTINKDYRKVDGTYNATIVVKANGTGGNTMWFKVVDVESSAKNLNVDNYKPYTYDMVSYSGATVTLSTRKSATAKDYNYEAGKSYEVAKFKVKAPADSAIRVSGFSLVNEYATANDRVDVERFLEKVTVTVDGEAVKAKYSVDRDAKVSVSFDAIEVAAKKSIEFVVSESFAEDFDQYDKYIEYTIYSNDFNAIDSKTESRVQVNVTNLPLTAYHFLGGKVKLSNVKVWNVDAAYGSTNVKIAEWSISTSEALRGTFSLYAKNSTLFSGAKGYSAIDTMKISIAGEEYDTPTRFYSFETFTDNACATTPSWGTTTWEAVLEEGATLRITKNDINTGFVDTHFVVTGTGGADCYVISGTDINFVGSVKVKEGFRFTNVDIENAGKVVVKVDLTEEAAFEWTKITFDSFNASSFEALSYEDTRRLDAKENINWFVNLYQLTVKPGKAALKNNLTTSKAVEFIKSEPSAKVVFDGTYTAKNGSVELTDWTINGMNPYPTTGKVTFYLSIDGEEVDDVLINATSVTRQLSNIKIAEGKEVKVLITAEVDWNLTWSLGNYQIIFNGEDENSNPAGQASARTSNMSIVEKGSVTVSNDAVKNTALRKAAQQTLAEFTVKPSNGASDVDFDSIAFTITGGDFTDFTEYDVTLSINNSEENADVTVTPTSINVTANPFVTLDSAGVNVKVVLEKEVAGNIELTGLTLNGTAQNKKFSKYFVESLVSFDSLVEENAGYTEYKLSIDWDSAYTISGFVVYLASWSCAPSFSWAADMTSAKLDTVADGDTIIIKRTEDVQEVCGVEYEVWDTTKLQTVSIAKTTYGDYFKVGGKAMVIPAKKA